MTEDTGAGPQGLDAIIDAAIEQHTPDEGGSPPSPVVEETASDKPRDERGRFVSAETKPSEGAAEVSVTAEVPAPDPVTPIEAPRNFTAELKAQFAQLSPEVQALVVQVEKAREGEYTRRSQEAAEYKRTADPFMQAVTPYQQYLAQVAPSIGQTPAGMINSILAAEYQLRTGTPEQRVQAFAQLAQQYGVNPATLTGGQPAAYQQQHQAPSYNPQFMQMRQELDALKAAREEEFDRQLTNQIESFKSAKDEKGKARYPHFEAVKSAMALALHNGEVETLEDAYVRAMEPFKAAIHVEIEAHKQQLEAERQASVEKARKASPVRGSPTPSSGASQPQGLDAIISAAIDKAGIA